MREIPCYLGHDWLAPRDASITVTDPATADTVVAKVAKLTRHHVNTAVGTAQEAQKSWARSPLAERAEVLRRAADILERRSDDVVADLTAEGGKPLREARGEVAKAVTTFRYYAGLVGALDGRVFEGARRHLRHETRQEPVGVVVAITPWNVPAASPARKLAPALLAGNSVVLKPASATPITAWHLVEVLLEAGLPAGTMQLVCGSGGEVGEGLALHPDVAAISFTGSTEVGLDLKAALGRSLTRLQLELGGKNAAVVLPDADLEVAVKHITAAAFTSAGQQCTATSRVIVHEEVAEALIRRLVEAAEALVMGDTREEATDMGPLIDLDQLRISEGFVARAVADGATLATGGRRLDLPGFFYAPTILTAVKPTMEVACTEVFGPVLSVIPVSSLKEALKVMNSTVYGLSAAVHTRDFASAQHVIEGTDAGVVAVNGPTAGIELAAPFGGFKLSGTASKEHGPESLEFYTRTKLVSWGWS